MDQFTTVLVRIDFVAVIQIVGTYQSTIFLQLTHLPIALFVHIDTAFKIHFQFQNAIKHGSWLLYAIAEGTFVM